MKKDVAIKIIDILKETYPDAKCSLDFSTPFEMLVAVILSAQCTDKRVNEVTSEMYKKYNKPEDFADMPLEQLENLIHSCGFYHNKALAIKNASREILERFNGKVPSNFDDLCSLPGVGRKTANVVMIEAFGGDAIPVDTHVLRVSNRLGLAKTKNPDVCEENLKKIFPKESWAKLHKRMVLFGRYKCKAINPECEGCPFSSFCLEKVEKYSKGKTKKK